MPDPTRPFLVLYVVWHPKYKAGAGMAEALCEHFRRKLFENVAGGAGISVIFRAAVAPGSDRPLPIDLNDAETSAIVVLAEKNLAADKPWCQYIQELVSRTEAMGLGTRVFPVTLDKAAFGLKLSEQAFRWDLWKGSDPQRRQRLIAELAYELCRMLRFQLEHLKRPLEEEEALERYLKKVQIFISHSKHDKDGIRIALAIRDKLQKGHGLASFFDVHDIPGGLRFEKVLLYQVKASAVVAVHTDSYSSRDWCRQEILEAKRWAVPLVVADCLSDLDERGFPYLGNVPIIRMDPGKPARIDTLVGRLLDEVLKDFLWKCRVQLAVAVSDPSTFFVPRQPELVCLASLPALDPGVVSRVIVYPDPPLSDGESQLFARVAPHVRLRSMNEWLAAP
ncbi:MAG: hypothetical protein JWL65_4006 [Gammaproteobacteria bacterium]|nr:hypothetical protein [Gammaproteobacteria bacterium]